LLAFVVHYILTLVGVEEFVVKAFDLSLFVGYLWFVYSFSGIFGKPVMFVEARPEDGEKQNFLVYNEGGIEFGLSVSDKSLKLLNSGAPCFLFRLLFLVYVY